MSICLWDGFLQTIISLSPDYDFTSLTYGPAFQHSAESLETLLTKVQDTVATVTSSQYGNAKILEAIEALGDKLQAKNVEDRKHLFNVVSGNIGTNIAILYNTACQLLSEYQGRLHYSDYIDGTIISKWYAAYDPSVGWGSTWHYDYEIAVQLIDGTFEETAYNYDIHFEYPVANESGWHKEIADFSTTSGTPNEGDWTIHAHYQGYVSMPAISELTWIHDLLNAHTLFTAKGVDNELLPDKKTADLSCLWGWDTIPPGEQKEWSTSWFKTVFPWWHTGQGGP